MDLDRVGYGSKARLLNFKLIEAVGQALHVESTLIAGRQSIPVLIRVTRDLDGGSYAQPARIDYFKA
jgi:hypothetical protein